MQRVGEWGESVWETSQQALMIKRDHTDWQQVNCMSARSAFQSLHIFNRPGCKASLLRCLQTVWFSANCFWLKCQYGCGLLSSLRAPSCLSTTHTPSPHKQGSTHDMGSYLSTLGIVSGNKPGLWGAFSLIGKADWDKRPLNLILPPAVAGDCRGKHGSLGMKKGTGKIWGKRQWKQASVFNQSRNCDSLKRKEAPRVLFASIISRRYSSGNIALYLL